MKRKNTTLLIALLAVTTVVKAQQNITASGGEATGIGGSSSFSIGQLDYISSTGSGGTVLEGVQQSIEIFTLSNPKLTGLQLKAATHPNPTNDYVILSLSESLLSNLSYALYDIHGQKVTNGTINQTNTQISLQTLSTGIYFLRVHQNNQELKTFKIIKQ